MRRRESAARSTATASRATGSSAISCALSDEMRGERSARRKLAAPFAQIGEAQDRIDEIVVGAEFQRIHAGLAKRRAQFFFALFGRRREALTKTAIVRVDEKLFAGFGVLDDEQAEIGQFHFQRIVQA